MLLNWLGLKEQLKSKIDEFIEFGVREGTPEIITTETENEYGEKSVHYEYEQFGDYGIRNGFLFKDDTKIGVDYEKLTVLLEKDNFQEFLITYKQFIDYGISTGILVKDGTRIVPDYEKLTSLPEYDYLLEERPKETGFSPRRIAEAIESVSQKDLEPSEHTFNNESQEQL